MVLRALILLGLFLLPELVEAQTTAKFNFRDSNGYCTDDADAVPVAGSADGYPQTDGSFDFGWESTSGDMSRDRDNTKCDDFAGINFAPNNSSGQLVFRVDLPEAGEYCIRVAFGDNFNDKSDQYFQIIDDASVLATCDDTNGTTAGQYTDATCVTRTSAADWTSNNAENCLEFSSTILRIRIATPDDRSGEPDPSTSIAHLSVTGPTPGGSVSIIPLLTETIGY